MAEAGPGWVVHCGDALDPVSGLASLPDKSVDHFIADPPYEIEAHRDQVRAGPLGGGRDTERVAIPFPAITAEHRREFALHSARIARRWVIAFCQAEAVAAWRDAFVAAGLSYRRSAIWVKPNAMPQITGDRPAMGYESIAMAHAPGRSRWNGGGRPGVYTCPMATEGLHPTAKPVALMETLIRDFTDPGETICDPFLGSGSTLVAAKRLGRKGIGWELNPEYAAIARKRIDAAREQFELFGAGRAAEGER